MNEWTTNTGGGQPEAAATVTEHAHNQRSTATRSDTNTRRFGRGEDEADAGANFKGERESEREGAEREDGCRWRRRASDRELPVEHTAEAAHVRGDRAASRHRSRSSYRRAD
jgi:hypothetical protein